MPGLVPGIHVFAASLVARTWMAGTSPAMTRRRGRARDNSAAFAVLACLQLSRYRDPRPRNDWYRARSSAGEHYLDMVGVTGSIPVAPTSLRELRRGKPLLAPSAFWRFGYASTYPRVWRRLASGTTAYAYSAVYSLSYGP